MPGPHFPPLPQSWGRVLDDVAAALDQAVADAAAREQHAAELAAPRVGRTAREALNQEFGRRLQTRLGARQARLDQAEKQAAAADAVLGTAEEALGQWLAAIAAYRPRARPWARQAT